MKTNASHNRHRIALAVLCTTLHMAGARAAQAPTEDSLWYYEIGGAEPVSAPDLMLFRVLVTASTGSNLPQL